MSGTASDLIAGLEAGGTKFVCGIGTGGDRLLARVAFPTGNDPATVLSKIVEWLTLQQNQFGPVKALGIASFGPVELHPDSPTFGLITSTPKPGWQNTDLITPLRRAVGDIPVGFDTDVNGAALAERRWGAACGLDDFIYLTMGTGIGGGGMARGQLLHGLVHPEMGHLRLPRLAGDTFPGVCPFHGDCWEGLCSGPAILARTGVPAEDLPADHPTWPQVVEYTAMAIANLICTLSPRRIILGGSIRKAGHFTEARFFRLLCERVQRLMTGYVVAPPLIGEAIHEYIVPPLLGDDAGVIGALELGRNTLGAM
ncbi:ROK family protein [soil metagenome]